jgi:MFS family permease
MRRLLVGLGLNAIGTGFVLPFLLIYLHEVRHISLAVAGAIVATEGAVGLVAGPVLGAWIDRIGARRVLVFALSASTAGALLLVETRSAATGFLACALTGIGTAGFWPATSWLVAALVPSPQRARYFGLNFVLLNLGIGLGGVAAAAVVRAGHPGSYQVLFAVDAVTYVGFAVVLATVRLTAPSAEEEVAAVAPSGSVGGYRSLLRAPLFRAVVVLQLVMVFAGYSELPAGFPAFVRQRAVSPHIVGIAYAVNTATIVLAQMWLQRRTSRWRRTRALVAVVLLWSLAWLLLGCALLLPKGAAASVIAIVFMAAFAVGEMLLSPTMPAIINDLAPVELRGRWNAAVSWCWSVGNVVGPAFAGVLLGAHLAVVWLAAVLAACLLAGWLALRIERVLPAAANNVDEPASSLAPVPAHR